METTHSQQGEAGHAYRADFKFNPSLGYTGKPCFTKWNKKHIPGPT